MNLYFCIASLLFVISPTLEESFETFDDDTITTSTGLFKCIPISLTAVRCEDIESNEELKNQLNYIGSRKISSLVLKSSDLPLISVDILSKYNIRFLHLNNVTLNTFFSSSLNVTNPLVHLVIKKIHLNTTWSWNQFQGLNNLRTLVVLHTHIGSDLTEDFGLHVSHKIQKLILLGVGVTRVQSSVFAELRDLAYLSLSRNGIKSLKKNCFPRLLQHLRLHHNRIHSLEDAAFEELTSLKTIDLSHNDIGSLPEAVFGDLWRNYTSIKLYDNPLKCDCSLSWMLTSLGQPLRLEGRCLHPKNNYGKKLARLSTNHLKCTR